MKAKYGLILLTALSLAPSYLAEGATTLRKNRIRSEEIRGIFIEALDARISGDLPRFCSYLAKDYYHRRNGKKIENFCAKIDKERISRCKNKNIGLEEAINLNSIKIYSPKELIKMAGQQAELIYHLTGTEYGASVKTNMLCTGDSLGAIFKKEDGSWKINSWQE